MKTKMFTITMILTVLIVWTSGSAWAKNNRGQKHRQEVKTHNNYDKRVQQRHDYRSHQPSKYKGKRPHHRQEKWDRRAHKYQNKHHRRHHYRPAPPVKHHYRRHHQPRRPVHGHKHHDSGFLFGLSMYEPDQAFSIVLGGRH